MAERNVSVRLAVVDGNRVKAELRSVGDEGSRSLDRIARASAPASAALKAVDAAGSSLRGSIDGMAGRTGAVGAALSALGPAGAVAAAGLAAAGFAVGQGLMDFAEAERQYLRLEQVLRATGYASGLTAGQVTALAEEIEQATFATAEQVQEAAGILATFRSVSGDVFREAIVLAQDLSAVFGQSLSSSATQLGKALEDPVQGITALRRVGVNFNATQRETIENFVRTGQTAQAQQLILNVLRQQVGGAGAAEGEGLAGAFDRARDATGNFLEKLVEVTGLAATAEAALLGVAAGADALTQSMTGAAVSAQIPAVTEELRQAQDELAAFEEAARRSGLGADEIQAEAWRDRVERLKAELDDLLARRQAEADEIERAEAGRAAAASDARTEQAMTRLRDLRIELESLATPEEKVAQIRERLAETVQQLNALRNADGSNAKAVDDALNTADELAKRRIDAIEKPARDAAEQGVARAKETIAELSRSVATFGDSRTQAIDDAISRLGDGATPEQRAEVARLAGALHDLGAAKKGATSASRDLQKIEVDGKQVFEATRTEAERYAAEIAKLNELLAAGAIDHHTYARAAANAAEELRHAQTDPLSGALRALDDYAKSAADMASGIEGAISSAFSGAENAVAEFVKTGKLDVSDLVTSILADLSRLAVRQTVLGPLSKALSSMLSSSFGSAAAGNAGGATVDAVTMHGGGTVGAAGAPTRTPLSLFTDAPRLHDGGSVLRPDEVPAILQTGERVLSRREVAEQNRSAAPITVNIYAQDTRSFMASRTQIAAELSRMVEVGRRGR
ncbi:MAG: phage tail length tape measure family protein [Methylobacterium mesophilicum]|nr:phage tail length tape measure family protein [Methylobacterium mesophilicum]